MADQNEPTRLEREMADTPRLPNNVRPQEPSVRTHDELISRLEALAREEQIHDDALINLNSIELMGRPLNELTEEERVTFRHRLQERVQEQVQQRAQQPFIRDHYSAGLQEEVTRPPSQTERTIGQHVRPPSETERRPNPIERIWNEQNPEWLTGLPPIGMNRNGPPTETEMTIGRGQQQAPQLIPGLPIGSDPMRPPVPMIPPIEETPEQRRAALSHIVQGLKDISDPIPADLVNELNAPLKNVSRPQLGSDEKRR